MTVANMGRDGYLDRARGSVIVFRTWIGDVVNPFVV